MAEGAQEILFQVLASEGKILCTHKTQGMENLWPRPLHAPKKITVLPPSDRNKPLKKIVGESGNKCLFPICPVLPGLLPANHKVILDLQILQELSGKSWRYYI